MEIKQLIRWVDEINKKYVSADNTIKCFITYTSKSNIKDSWTIRIKLIHLKLRYRITSSCDSRVGKNFSTLEK